MNRNGKGKSSGKGCCRRIKFDQFTCDLQELAPDPCQHCFLKFAVSLHTPGNTDLSVRKSKGTQAGTYMDRVHGPGSSVHLPVAPVHFTRQEIQGGRKASSCGCGTAVGHEMSGHRVEEDEGQVSRAKRCEHFDRCTVSFLLGILKAIYSIL